MSESLPQSQLNILDENQLGFIEKLNFDSKIPYSVGQNLIYSHRFLLSANEELRTDRDIALQAADNAIKQTVVLSDRVTALEAALTIIAEEDYPYAPITVYSIKNFFIETAQNALKGAEPNDHNPL